MLLAQAVPEPQVLPAQQASPAPPHAWQTLLVQAVEAAVQAPLAQQGWPGPPQDWQVLLAQVTPAAVQAWLAQQAWLAAPQVPHEPEAQVPPPTEVGQLWPEPTQRLFTQQPPAPQALPAQQR
jgi:hypothetical protein